MAIDRIFSTPVQRRIKLIRPNLKEMCPSRFSLNNIYNTLMHTAKKLNKLPASLFVEILF